MLTVAAAALTCGYILGRYRPLRDARRRAHAVAGLASSTRTDRAWYLLLHPFAGISARRKNPGTPTTI